MNMMIHPFLSDVICPKCGKEAIYIVQKENTKDDPMKKTLDQYLSEMYAPIPAVYKLTTYQCKECGYSVSR